MITLNRKNAISAFVKALLFTLVMMILKIIWAKNDDEMNTLFDSTFFAYRLITLALFFLIFYFARDKNPSWKDVFKPFKK